MTSDSRSARMRDAPDAHVLLTLERYYDAVPRSRARSEEVGPFTLFVAETGWPYYGRPRAGLDKAIRPADVHQLHARQQELHVPRSLEWVDEVTPGLVDVVRAAGAPVERCPLLVLGGEPHGGPGTARVLDPDVPADVSDLSASRAAVSVSFSNPGTATGPAGLEEREQAMTSKYADLHDSLLASMRAGRLCQAAVYDPINPDAGPVGGGSYAAVEGVAEIAGVGVLPAYRRQGLAAQLTFVLARHALQHGVTTVFCSAQNDDVARVYSGVGFRRVGSACISEVADDA